MVDVGPLTPAGTRRGAGWARVVLREGREVDTRPACLTGRVDRATPGSLNLNSGLVWRAVIYAGLPLLTITSMRFPEVGGQLVTVVEPLRHLLPTP